MHVLFDARLLHRPLSGLERVQKNLLRELALAPQIERLSVLVQRGTKLPADFPARAHPVQVQTSEDILTLLLADPKAGRPDVYHMTFVPDRSPKDLWLPIAAHASVVEVHDAILNRYPEYHHDANSYSGYDAFVRRLVRCCDRLLVHSKSVVDEVVKDLGGDRRITDVAPLAVDPALRDPLPTVEAAKRRARLGVPERYFVVLGKDYPHKDHPTLLRAFARVAGAQLVCAGSKGWHKGGVSTDELCKELGIGDKARWLQGLSDEDVKALLQGALALVYPSREEGFGLPPIEAMGLGTPVLAAASMSIPEVCGDAAFLFQPGDDAELARLMQVVLAGGPEVERMVARGRQREATFSWRRCAERTFACYQNAIDSSHRKARPRPTLSKPFARILSVLANSPFSAERELAAWQERCLSVEHTLGELRAEFAKVAGRAAAPASMPPAPEPGAPMVEVTNAEPDRPRFSLRRRMRKIRDGIKKRLTKG